MDLGRPPNFNGLADEIQWILDTKGISPLLHYLDDFLLFGRPHTEGCAKALTTALSCCEQLGVPIASKTEGPSSSLTFLGIEIDTEARELRLPVDKLGRLQKEISLWTSRKFTTKRQMQHAASVVRPGRSFLRGMTLLSTIPRELHHRVRLNRGFRSDLRWCPIFAILKWS